MKNESQALAKALSALTLISAPRRPDGTYNRDRLACEQLARQALAEIDAITGAREDEGGEAWAEQVMASVSAPLPAARPVPGTTTSPSQPNAPSGSAHALTFLSKDPRQGRGREFVVNTDGACKGNPGNSSWGVTVEGDGILQIAEGGYLGVQTNQVAELMAALEGLRRTPVGAKVLLKSDSQYTLKGLDDWRKGWERNGWKTASKEPVKNKEIWVALSAEADKRTVTCEWVRGHNGDPMNEKCDTLANEAVAARGTVVHV